MSIMENVLDFLYEKDADSYDSVSMELNQCQQTLEKQGFKVKRLGQLVNHKAIQSIAAKKGNVVLKVTRFWEGGKDLSVVIKHGGHATTVPLFCNKIEEAIAVVNAAQKIQ